MTPELTHDDLPPHPTLSPLQQRAAHMLALGWSYRRISAEIGVSKSTVGLWKEIPEFAGQIGTFSAEFTRRFQATNLRAAAKAVRALHHIAFDESARTSDRLAAIGRILDMALDWHVVRPLEISRHKLEAMGDRGP